jgi:UDP-N-acetylmuramate--alanine ligase
MLGFSKDLVVHFIGIGGIGMSGIAEILLALGYKVSGSDLNTSSVTEKLQSLGAKIYQGHNAQNVVNADIIVYSSAIDTTNPEIISAKLKKIPIIRRAEMLAELMRLKIGIAIAGAHGKTTTTSMVATIFDKAKLDPTHVIGGIVHNLGNHAKSGKGEYIIVEADESDGSFLLLRPIMCVVTNIDNDHLDHYKNVENIHKSFIEFINNLPFYGKAILWGNDPQIQKIAEHIKRRITYFGITHSNNFKNELAYSASDIQYFVDGCNFNVMSNNKSLGKISLQVTGEHNVLNAMAAISISLEAGLSFEEVKNGIFEFKGVGRRLERLYKKNEFEIIDDYGHHPTEIKATIKTLKEIYKKKLTVVFEPHRYTRTKELWSDFLTAFEGADEVYILPIYAASEKEIPEITSEKLSKQIKVYNTTASYLKSFEDLKKLVSEKINNDQVLLTLGAGAISKQMKKIVNEL